MSLGKNHKRFQSKLWNVLQFWIGLNHRVFLGLASVIRERLYVSLCPACNIVDILIKWGPNKWSLRHLLKTLYQPSRVLILRILVWFNKLTLMVEIKVKYLTDIYWLFSIRFVFISPFPQRSRVCSTQLRQDTASQRRSRHYFHLSDTEWVRWFPTIEPCIFHLNIWQVFQYHNKMLFIFSDKTWSSCKTPFSVATCRLGSLLLSKLWKQFLSVQSPLRIKITILFFYLGRWTESRKDIISAQRRFIAPGYINA